MRTPLSTLRKALHLPGTYRITAAVEIRKQVDGRIKLSTVYRLASGTPGTMSTFALVDAGSLAITELTKDQFRQLTTEELLYTA